VHFVVLTTLVRWCPALQPQQPDDDEEEVEDGEDEENADGSGVNQDAGGRNGQKKT